MRTSPPGERAGVPRIFDMEFPCRMWWTITGTFGNILPIDWSKSYARKMHMPALNLNEAPAPTER